MLHGFVSGIKQRNFDILPFCLPVPGKSLSLTTWPKNFGLNTFLI